ncbi:MAG: GIY-YIG nuclease family protein [Candidatus Aenigmatarchaeota archaeon]
MKGTYVLILKCLKNCRIKIGKIGTIEFKKGYYFYVGSAFNSLEKRIERHLKRKKKKKWHIDYLTTNKNFKVIDVIWIRKRVESKLSKEFEKHFEYIKNFGSSDTKDKSHLFYYNGRFSR